LQGLRRDAGFEAAGEGLLEEECRDQRCQVRVAAPLSQPVQRALDLPRPGFDRGEGVGNGVAGVVVAVDAEPVARDAGGDDLGGDAADLGGERATVGVAEDDPAGTGLQRGVEAGEGVGWVRPVAVEEVFRVEQGIEETMASRFSSRVTLRAVVTWKSWVLPTRQTAGVPAFRTAARTSSFSADRPTRRVMPKAVRVALVAGGAAKKSESVGLAPGQPPSM
jgi:hypothetical protein